MKNLKSILVALVALVASAQCQAPAPGPTPPGAVMPGAVMPGAVMPGAVMPGGVTSSNNGGSGAVQPTIGGLNTVPAVPGPLPAQSGPGTGAQMPPQNGTSPGSAVGGQAGPTANSSPATNNTSPTATSAPIAPPTVAFVSHLPIDTPDTFANGHPNGATSGPTYAQAWCNNLANQFLGSLCSATATPGSVNVQTVMTFPVSTSSGSNANAVAQANQLTAKLQQIASNPAAAAALFPASLGVGNVTVSGISVTGNFVVAAPAPAPAMLPLKPVARIISFLARLTQYGQPSDFNTGIQLLWCARLTYKYPTAQCAVTQVTAGSVNVATSMGFPQNDNSAQALYTQLESISSGTGSASDLFGSSFGPVAVTSVSDSSNTASTASTPTPSPPAGHHLSGGKIAGAVIGSIVGAALLAGCGFYGYKYYKSRQSYSPANMA